MSQNKAESNRVNAQKSTGPVTPSGKARSSQNALKNGFYAKSGLLENEDFCAFLELQSDVKKNLCPVGPIEECLVDQITYAVWRLRRLRTVEAQIFEVHKYSAEMNRCDVKRNNLEQIINPSYMSHTQNYKSLESKFDSAERMRHRMKLGSAFLLDSSGPEGFAKLARYQSTTEKSFYRALHELQRLQATRLGQRVALPLAVDLTVSQEETGNEQGKNSFLTE